MGQPHGRYRLKQIEAATAAIAAAAAARLGAAAAEEDADAASSAAIAAVTTDAPIHIKLHNICIEAGIQKAAAP